MKLSDIGEFGLIQLIRKTAPSRQGVIRGIGDDTAVLEWNSREYLLFTTDMLIENVHFRRWVGGRLIGHKALACNISDIAAMDGVPTYAVVSLGVAPKTDVRFIQEIYSGMNRLAKKFGVAIVGGDTVKSQKLVINIALLGRVEKNRLVTRCGAKVGDRIFVTGKLGRSLQSGRHLNFTPRIKAARFFGKKAKPSAMIDISDGLAADLGHILRESSVGAQLDETAIPRNVHATLSNALYDGEDFELLFTLAPRTAERLKKMRQGFHFFEIGRIVERSQGLTLLTKDGKVVRLPKKGFKHF